jgi:acyl-CoA thioesterase FadM
MAGHLLYSAVVQEAWLDCLDHLNFLQYQRIADKATDQFWLEIGGRPLSTAERLALIIVETHVRYRRELRLGDSVSVLTQLIGHDWRRVHLHHTLVRDQDPVCTVQILGLAFDPSTRRAAQWPGLMLESLRSWLTHPSQRPLELMPWQLTLPADNA